MYIFQNFVNKYKKVQLYSEHIAAYVYMYI